MLRTAATILATAAGVAFAQTGELIPPAGTPISTGKPLEKIEPRISVDLESMTSDQFDVPENTSAYLASSIAVTGGSGSFIVPVRVGDGSTLDLMGFTISWIGPGTPNRDGVSGSSGFDRTRIRNGRIKGFQTGVRVVTGSTVSDMEVVDADDLGIGVFGGVTASSETPSLVQRCRVTGLTTTGVQITNSGVIRDCVIDGATTAIFVGGDALIENCVIRNCGRGIQVNGNATIRNCIIENLTAEPLTVLGSLTMSDTTITNAAAAIDVNGAAEISDSTLNVILPDTLDAGDESRLTGVNIVEGGAVRLGNRSSLDQCNLEQIAGANSISTGFGSTIERCRVQAQVGQAQGVVIGANSAVRSSFFRGATIFLPNVSTADCDIDSNIIQNANINMNSSGFNTIIRNNISAGLISNTGGVSNLIGPDDITSPWANFID